MPEALHYEDIEEGMTLASPWYTVTREAIVAFAQEWDPYPFHLDEQAAEASSFGGLAACAAHIFAIQSLLTHQLPQGVALIAGLGGDGLDLLAPVRPGQRLRLVRRYTGKRASQSRPDTGIVGIEHTLETPDGEPLFRTTGSILVHRRPDPL